MAVKRKVLIVEDNLLNREMLAEILSEKYEVYQAENGVEGLEILRKYEDSLSLILLDVMMPVMNGYEFLDNLHKDEKLSLIPVIVTTQRDGCGEEINALQHGATDFVPKPYNAQIILQRMENLIRLRETSAVVNQMKYDSLTGLYDKQYFYTSVRNRLNEDPDTEYMILSSNIENFKLFNDAFGIQEGDRLLKETAESMKEAIGDLGFCGRIRGDRFAAFIPVERLKELNGRCDRLPETYRELGLGNRIVMRWGLYRITDTEVSIEQMCDRALLAADSIRGKYDTMYAFYDDRIRAALLRDKMLTDSMDTALAEHQFTVYLQPKYSLKTESIIGAEALVRWNHPTLGFISPGEFIPLFEKNGFIRRLDMYVWDCVCAKIADWKKRGLPVYPVSVNVSRADLFQNETVKYMQSLVERYHIRPGDLHLEITESAYAENMDTVIQAVRQLRECGFIIEMDDFGSGYSSLNMLSQMAVDIIKLDLKFIHAEIQKPADSSILNDVISMAHRLHMYVVAEGVETKKQARKLREVSCDCAQGYYFAKPMPSDDYETVLLSQPGKEERHHESHDDVHSEVILLVDENRTYREALKTACGESCELKCFDDGIGAAEYMNRNTSSHIMALILSATVETGMPELMNALDEHDSHVPVLCLISDNQRENLPENIEMADEFLCRKHPMFDIRRHIERLVVMSRTLRQKQNEVSEDTYDSLSGLLNHKGLEIRMNELSRKDMPLAVCLFDIDSLKRINERFGHESGDRIISLFSDQLSIGTRTDDIHCRYGGDEFLIVMKNAGNRELIQSRCMEICETFHQATEEIHMPCTVSCGICFCTTVSDTMDAVCRADQALYEVRQNRQENCSVCESMNKSCS